MWIGDDLGFDPNWLMACMAFETGRRFTANVKNPGSSATGLIQFMTTTATELGTTTAALAALSAEAQLNFVYRYFAKRIKEHGVPRRLTDCYMAILLPSAMGKADDEVLWPVGTKTYFANRGLDTDKDGRITKAEAGAKVHAMLAEGLKPENVA